MTNQEKLNILKDGLTKSIKLRDQALARKESYEERKKEIEKNIRELGVEPDKIDQELKKIEAEIKELMEQTEKLIPFELLEKFNIK
ncbi:MAG: hypothetical protein PHP06_06310 [Clostridia bacterium]|nr:hypothetical protein [Clostridia bacterium]